jgi:hypothetical protein
MMPFVMRWGNHFRSAVLAFALAACVGSAEVVRTVGLEEYRSRSCWFDTGGDFESFLLLAHGEERAIAFPISGKCLVEPGQRSLAQMTVRQIGIVDLVDEHGELRRAFPGFTLSDSTTTDQEGMPDGRLYYFRARVTNVPLANGLAYAPVRILQLDDTHMTFSRFLELDAAGRTSLWRARHS